MKLWAHLRGFLTVLAIVGLTVAPVVRPALALAAKTATAEANEASSHHAAIGNMPDEMAAGMPCCPDEAPVPDCVKDCPLMAICMGGVLQYVPFAPSLLLPLTPTSVLAFGTDAYLERLAQAPPPRPPKA